MSNIYSVWAREATFGSLPQKTLTRTYQVQATDFVSNEQAVPYPIFFGTVQLDGTAITPIFNFQAIPQHSSVGK